MKEEARRYFEAAAAKAEERDERRVAKRIDKWLKRAAQPEPASPHAA